MAKVTFESQPKLTKREVEVLEIVREEGLGDLLQAAMAYAFLVSDGDLISLDFENIAEAYVLGYEEVE